MNNTFTQFEESYIQLFKQLFGAKTLKELNSIPLKCIKYKGIDVTTTQITATTPNIKEKFSKKWVEYFEERGDTAFRLFLQSIFHLGYQQGVDCNKKDAYMEKLLSELKQKEHFEK